MANRIIQYPVPLILRKVLKDQSNGELIVVGKDFTKNLYFIDGHLVFAKTTVIEERLGEILFKIGKINKEQFLSITELVKDTTERLGKLMVQKDMLSQRDLFFALIYQLRTIATSTFTLMSGEWNFINRVPEVPDDSKFRIHLPGIISEGTNKIGNLSYFRNRFYYKSPHLGAVPEQVKEVLSTNELNFYKDIQEFKNLPNEHIVDKMKVSEDTYWKKVVLFYLLNVAEFKEVEKDKERDENIENIISLYESIKANRFDYYQLLSLTNAAVGGEIKNAYFELAKKYHPDRITSAPDPEIKDKANFVFAEINRAYETLSNPVKRNEYDMRGVSENSPDDAIHENLTEKAKLLYRRAKALYSQKKFWEASSILDEAVKLDSRKTSYFLLLGLCQMNLPALKRMAANNLQKAIELDSYNVEAYTAMGMLLMSENQNKRAEGFFRKALSMNPDHSLARKKLLEISGGETKRKGKFSLFGKKK